MTTNNLGGIDAGYYESVLTNSAIGVGLWHRDLSKYQTMARTAIELALDVCRPGADMANALNSPSQTLRAAAEALAFDAIVSLGYVVSASGDDVPTLGKRIETLEAAVKKYRTQSGVSLQVYAGKKELRGDALLKALRQINYLIGGGPHFTNPNVPDGPLPIKPVFYSDFITALENFQRALEYLYASTQTLSEVRLKDSAGHLQYSIYVQDAVQVIRNETAESLKKMLDGDHVEILGTAHMLEQHGHLNAPTQSHDSFATRLFDPVAGISSIGDPVRLEEALSSDAPAILIQGEGGCGKTVALWRFGLQTNTNEYRDDIAIYTKLDGGFPSSTLNKQIAAAAHYASDSRRIYVLLDGLDEIRSRRSLVVTAIADLIARYSKLLWRVSTRELGGEPAEETRAWHLFKMDRFAVDSIVSGIRRLEHVNASMRDQAVTLIKSERPLAAVLGTAFYYALFCWRLLDLDRVGVATRVGEPRQVFRSRLLKFGLDKYVQRELERSAITATQQAIDDWIITWTKAGLNELLAVPDAARVNDQIVNPTSKHELFGDWLLASYLAKANPQDVQGALTQMPGPRRRSVLSLILEVLLLADKATALTDAMFRVDPLMAAAGFVRRNAINASVPPEYFFNQSLAAKLLKEEFDESPWLKAAVSALMCGPAHVATNEAIKEIAYQRVSSVPVSIQQTLSESAFWLLLDVQAAVYGPPNTAEILAKHVFDTPEPWAELGGYGYDYWIHYRQSLTGLSHVEQVARGAPVLDTRPSAGEQQALENLPASLQARYWLSLEARIDGQEDIEDRASLSVKWLAQHCTQLSFRLIHRLVVKRLIPKMSGTPRDFTTLIERAKQTPLLLPELFNIVPRVQVYAALKDPAILELFIAQVTPTAAAQFFRHVKPSDDPHDPHGAERQAWRDSVVTSLRDKRWCEKADPAEMQRLWEIGVIEPLSKAKKNRWQRSMRMRDASLLKRAEIGRASCRERV